MAAKGVSIKGAHTEGRGALRYTPDGRQLITCGADTFVKIFEADNLGAEPRTIETHDSPVNTLAINNKGTYMATGTEGHMVSYFNYPSGSLVKNLTRGQSPIQHVAFDPKGRFLAVAGDDGVIRMVNVGIAQYTPLKGHTDAVLCVAFDPKGEYLASSSADGTVRIWDVTDEPTAVKTIKLGGKVQPNVGQLLRVAWHPSGSSLAVPYANGVNILERGTWANETALLHGHTKEVSLVAWSANGKYLASAGLDRQVFVWDPESSDSLDRHKSEATLTDLQWSPRDNALAFLDEAGQLGLWAAPIPTHLASPVGAVGGAIGEVPAALVAPPTAAVNAAAAAESTIFSVDDAAAIDAIEASAAAPDPIMVDEAADGVAAAAAATRGRRLRKVMHDSDDGGFSDHDDDEAAEAALLAREIAKRSGGTVSADAVLGASGGKVGGMSAAVAALVAAPLGGGAAPQAVVHPSATPAKNGRRFLLWNMTGAVLSRDENVFSAIEVDFNDMEKHRTIRLTDHYSFSMAALDDAAVMFAARANNGNPSTIVYRPLSSWAPNSEWQVQLDKGEEAEAIAVGHKFAAIATSARYLRVLSHTGAQRATMCFAHDLVALAASGGMLAVVQHAGRAAGPADQSLLLALYDLREPSRPVRIHSAPLPLSTGASLEWIGFSEGGVLASVDSAGIVRGCLRSYGFEWVPLLDTATCKKSKSEAHWIVGLTDKELLCVICKGDDKYPATLPRPVITPLSLSMPLACSEPAEPKLEGERLLSSLLLNEFRAAAVDDGADEDEAVQGRLLAGFTKLDGSTLKLLAQACKAERNARALDLATQLQLPKSLTGALKLANHYRMGPLAERVTKLMEAKFADAALDEDVEEAPPRVPPARRAPAKQEAAEEEGDDEAEAEAEAGDEAGAPAEAEAAEKASPSPAKPSYNRAPLNPFAKGNKAHLAVTNADTGKGPKRTLPVTAGAGKKMKK